MKVVGYSIPGGTLYHDEELNIWGVSDDAPDQYRPERIEWIGTKEEALEAWERTNTCKICNNC